MKNEMPPAERDLVIDLRRSDEATNGHPVLPAHQIERAREWLALVLLDADYGEPHFALLESLYEARFIPPHPRLLGSGEPWFPPDCAAGFPHNQPLPAAEAQALADRGPDAYPADKLALLLLNPVALWDVSDLISYRLPAYWLPRMEELGRKLVRERGIDVSIPGVDYFPGAGQEDEPEGSNELEAVLAQIEQLPASPHSLGPNGVAHQLLRPGESAIVLFLKLWRQEQKLTLNPATGGGRTGNWKIAETRWVDPPNRVILYVRKHPEGPRSPALVVVADCEDIGPSNEEGRSIVEFRGAVRAGEINQPWTAFADTSRSPVRYISG